MRYLIALLFLSISLQAQPTRSWTPRGRGALSSKPLSCNAGDVWICQGTGCTTTNDIYYCDPATRVYSASFAAAAGPVAFDAVTSGTNKSAAMVIDTGASLAASGTGTIAATSVAAAGVPNNAADTSGKATTAGNADTVTNGMTQTTANDTDNSVSVAVGTTGRAFEKTPFTIDPATGDASTTGGISTGVGGSDAGYLQMGQGTAPALVANTIQTLAPAAVTSYQIIYPGAAGTGFVKRTNAANVVTETVAALESADIPNNAADTSGKATTAGNADTVTNGVTATANITDSYAVVGDGGAKGVKVGAAIVEAATASTIPIRNASGEVIAANTVATGKTAMATDTVLAAGQIGLVPIAVNTGSDPCPTGTHCAFGTTYKAGYVFNQQTATDQIFIDLPTAATGLQWCIKNSVVGGTAAAVTGIITVKAQSGDYINADGTIGSSGGVLSSGGAAGDGACFVASAANHWEAFIGKGTWAP